MKLYAIVDENGKVMSGGSKRRLGVFKSLKTLKNNAFRYGGRYGYSIVEMNTDNVIGKVESIEKVD